MLLMDREGKEEKWEEKWVLPLLYSYVESTNLPVSQEFWSDTIKKIVVDKHKENTFLLLRQLTCEEFKNQLH